MKRLCLLGFVIAALFCSGSANGQDLEALLIGQAVEALRQKGTAAILGASKPEALIELQL